MSSRCRFVLVTILGAAVVAACNYGSSQPACTSEQLVPPEPVAPAHYGNIGTTANTSPIPDDLISWTYPEDCVPEHFKVSLSDEREFGVSRLGMTDGELAWPVPGDPAEIGLEPATEYFWRVRAWTDGVNGPDSPNRVFFTGPTCTDLTDAGAPELLSPDDGATVGQDWAELHYRPGGTPCVPDGYFVDLQTDPGFGGATLLGEYGIPGTYVLTDPLEDCTTYYWRVAPVVDGVRGPFSETRSFNISVAPTCMFPLTPPELDLELPSILCSPDDLVAPAQAAPANYTSVGTGPTVDLLSPELFQWESIGCIPDHYKLRFSPDRHFGIARAGMTDGELVWPATDAAFPQAPLEPATEYFWDVRAWDDGVNGPTSPKHVFFTGPTCAGPAELVAPEQLSPEEGAVVTTESAELHYRPGEPACLPGGYALDLQTDPAFGGTNLLGSYAIPGTYVLTEPLEDCTTYYWRVAATIGGTEGPFSTASSFTTDFEGLCIVPALGPPMAEGLRDIACYVGPNPAIWPIHGYLLAGEQAEILGQDLSGDWWVIDNPDGPDHCFARKQDTTLIGELGDLPIWRDPPLPATATPELVCKKDLSQSACTAAGGKWVQSATHAGYCDCP
jgi:hypothetical protein